MTPEDQELLKAIEERMNERHTKHVQNVRYGVLKPVRQRKQRNPPLADDLEALMALFKKYLLQEPNRADSE